MLPRLELIITSGTFRTTPLTIKMEKQDNQVLHTDPSHTTFITMPGRKLVLSRSQLLHPLVAQPLRLLSRLARLWIIKATLRLVSGLYKPNLVFPRLLVTVY